MTFFYRSVQFDGEFFISSVFCLVLYVLIKSANEKRKVFVLGISLHSASRKLFKRIKFTYLTVLSTSLRQAEIEHPFSDEKEKAIWVNFARNSAPLSFQPQRNKMRSESKVKRVKRILMKALAVIRPWNQNSVLCPLSIAIVNCTAKRKTWAICKRKLFCDATHCYPSGQV